MSVFVIAEAGVNHNGSLSIAKKLVDVAVSAGADAVKFQTFKADRLVSTSAPKADYQQKNMQSSETQYEMIKRLELDYNDHKELIAYCADRNILFMSTPFDHESIDLLNGFGMQVFKIPSGEITNLPYLRHVGSLAKRVILSTGMSDLGEVEDALDVLVGAGTVKKNITVLHATTEYPCPIDEVNLKAMLTMANAFHVDFGYSDHTEGIEIPIAAVAMGASVIEKHFTLDRNMEGPDHKASLEPAELESVVTAIRRVERALGTGVKKPTSSELKNKAIARKSLVAQTLIKKGEVLGEHNMTVKRPGDGINPMRWDELVGTIATRDYDVDDLII